MHCLCRQGHRAGIRTSRGISHLALTADFSRS